MELQSKNPRFFARLSVYLATAIRSLLNVLLLIIICALAIGTYKLGHDLFTSLHKTLDAVLREILLDVVFIVALVEISITVLSYLKDGRVHVRYIVDTIMIIMMNEIVTLWFTKPSWETAAGLSLIVATLAAVRITTVKYAPTDPDESEKVQAEES